MSTPSSSLCGEASISESESFEIINKSSESLYSVSAETYLSLPEDVLALSSIKELEDAIQNCKKLISSKTDDSEERKQLVRRLIELRIRFEELKEHDGGTDGGNKPKENDKVVLGHHFVRQNVLRNYSCERCHYLLWNNTAWYLCSGCNYASHEKCLSYVYRICAHVIVSENPSYVLDICPEPEDGLLNQNYRCAECLTHIAMTGDTTMSLFKAIPIPDTYEIYFSVLQVKKERTVSYSVLCDYTGKYYCTNCHWYSKSVIPARVIYNWDFSLRNVCRSSKQILDLMMKLPILNLQELNPMLFACIEELRTVKELRQQLMQIKKYLTTCKTALKNNFLWDHRYKIHLFENENNYSLEDLIELDSGELIAYLQKAKDDFAQHIVEDCEVCKGKGFFCEFCTDDKAIFPFEKNVISCSKCHAAFHFFCWMKNNQNCRKCERIRQRSCLIQEDSLINGGDS